MRPSFDQTEGYALSILDALAAGKRPHPLPAEKALEPSEELIRVGAERLSISMLRSLAAGGSRERTVLRGGRRVSGRIFDSAVNGGFRLHFTAASKDLWLGITHALLRQRGIEGIQQVPVEGTRDGDWLFYATAQQNLERIAAEPPADAPIQKRLRSGSPLVVLACLSPAQPQRASVESHVRRLMHPASLRVLECLDDRLLARWDARVRDVVLRAPSVDRLAAGANACASVLESYLACLDGAGRLDLAVTLMRFAVRLATRILDEPADAVRAHLTERLRPRTMRERADALGAVARIAQVGRTLGEHRRRLASIRYGEDRWEEGQLFIASYDAIVAPEAGRVADMALGLSGAIA
jgi:hypothetical protein